MFFIRLETQDIFKKVTGIYREKMEGQGWKETGAQSARDSVTRNYVKDTKVATVAINQANVKTRIQIETAPKKLK